MINPVFSNDFYTNSLLFWRPAQGVVKEVEAQPEESASSKSKPPLSRLSHNKCVVKEGVISMVPSSAPPTKPSFLGNLKGYFSFQLDPDQMALNQRLEQLFHNLHSPISSDSQQLMAQMRSHKMDGYLMLLHNLRLLNIDFALANEKHHLVLLFMRLANFVRRIFHWEQLPIQGWTNWSDSGVEKLLNSLKKRAFELNEQEKQDAPLLLEVEGSPKLMLKLREQNICKLFYGYKQRLSFTLGSNRFDLVYNNELKRFQLLFCMIKDVSKRRELFIPCKQSVMDVYERNPIKIKVEEGMVQSVAKLWLENKVMWLDNYRMVAFAPSKYASSLPLEPGCVYTLPKSGVIDSRLSEPTFSAPDLIETVAQGVSSEVGVSASSSTSSGNGSDVSSAISGSTGYEEVVSSSKQAALSTLPYLRLTPLDKFQIPFLNQGISSGL